MDTDAQEPSIDFLEQGALLRSRLKHLTKSGPVILRSNSRAAQENYEGSNMPPSPELILAEYLQHLQNKYSIFQDPNQPRVAQKRRKILQKYCIGIGKVPDSFFHEIEKRRSKGSKQNVQLSYAQRVEVATQLHNDQLSRLEGWLAALEDPAKNYPMWFRFYVLSSVVKLAEHPARAGKFKLRSPNSTSNFPEPNEFVLQNIYQHMTDPDFHSAKAQSQEAVLSKWEIIRKRQPLPEISASFKRLLEFWTDDFRTEITDIDLEQSKGKWVEFSDTTGAISSDITHALSGFNTGWCFASIGYATDYLENGSLHVLFTPSRDGDYRIPRVVIHMTGKQVSEIVGLEDGQLIEPSLAETLCQKLSSLPDGKLHIKRVKDSSRVAQLYTKQQNGEEFTRKELKFLYEVERPIERLNNRNDPRISMIKDLRSQKDDLALIFGCAPENVASTVDELSSSTTVCMFDVDRKTPLEQDQYPNVTTIVGDANFERMANRFPNVVRITGNARPYPGQAHLEIVGGLCTYSNAYEGLPALRRVGGSAMFSSTRADFPKLENVGGTLWAAHAKLDLPRLTHVGEDARIDGAVISPAIDLLGIKGQVIGTPRGTSAQALG